jgi:hypothetical protein
MEFKDLIGKTITDVKEMRKPDYDDEAWLRIDFSDKTYCVFAASYGGYTGKSEDEYPAYIAIQSNVEGIEEIKKE